MVNSADGTLKRCRLAAFGAVLMALTLGTASNFAIGIYFVNSMVGSFEGDGAATKKGVSGSSCLQAESH